MAVPAASGLVAGATPYGWATLAASVMGGAMQGTPAGPSRADAFFGGGVTGFDNSGWTVATGGGTASAIAGDRGGLSGSGVPGSGALANIPWTGVMVIGLIAAVMLWKKR
jgi:hypothetical protein